VRGVEEMVVLSKSRVEWSRVIKYEGEGLTMLQYPHISTSHLGHVRERQAVPSNMMAMWHWGHLLVMM